MINHKYGLSVLFALMIAFSGCSRQQSDWQKTREANTAEAYEQFLKKYPSGEFSAQAQARAKELDEERDWQKARDADTPEAYQAFLKQYPDGKASEEARIRVENFTLAQAPSGTGAGASADTPPDAAAAGASAAQSTQPIGTPGAALNRAPAAGPPGTAPSSAPKLAGALGGAAAGATAAASAAAPSAAPAAASSAAATPSAPDAAAKGLSGPYRVQLGAFKSGENAAKEHWAHLQQGYPSLLAGMRYKVLPKKAADGGNIYRLQAVGLTEKHARALCSTLKSNSEPCIVVPPA